MGTPLACPLYPVSANTRARLVTLSNKLPDGMVGRLTDEETVLIGRGDTANALELPSRTGIATMISAALSGFSGGPALASTAPSALAATAAAGTGTTAARADHVHALPAAATTTAAGLMAATDKSKLDSIATSANNYVHPTNHPASIITQDTSNRFVTDAEKTAWSAKAEGAHSHASASTSVAGFARFATPQEMDDGADGVAVTPYQFREALALALESVGDGAIPNLITAPTVVRGTAATGQPVPLTASGSQYIWGGSTGITYQWETSDGTATSGTTTSTAVGDTVYCQALDALGNKSERISVEITAGGGSGALTPGGTRIVSIPDGVTTLTMTGHGGKGTAAVAGTITFLSAVTTSGTVYTPGGTISPAVSTWSFSSPPTSITYMGITCTRTANTSYSIQYVSSSGTTTVNFGKSGGTAAAAGASTTVSGAAAATFSGAATGVTTVPATSTQIKALSTGTNRSVSVVIPSTGAMTLDWS